MSKFYEMLSHLKNIVSSCVSKHILNAFASLEKLHREHLCCTKKCTWRWRQLVPHRRQDFLGSWSLERCKKGGYSLSFKRHCFGKGHSLIFTKKRITFFSFLFPIAAQQLASFEMLILWTSVPLHSISIWSSHPNCQNFWNYLHKQMFHTQSWQKKRENRNNKILQQNLINHEIWVLQQNAIFAQKTLYLYLSEH